MPWRKTGVDPWGYDVLRGGTHKDVKELSFRFPLTEHVDVRGIPFLKRYRLEDVRKRGLTVYYRGKWIKGDKI